MDNLFDQYQPCEEYLIYFSENRKCLIPYESQQLKLSYLHENIGNDTT